MILSDILNIIESAAPLKWQEQWDNSGLQVGDLNANIQKALLTTDLTETVANEAISCGCQLIISHHPLLFHGLKHLTGATPQERIVETALKNGIAIYSSHTAMDSYIHGVSGRMAEKIGLTRYRILVPSVTYGDEVGLGVIGILPQAVKTVDFVQHVKTVFGAQWIRYTEGKNSVQTVALCGGAGAEFVSEAIRQGADAYISADFKYHDLQAVADQLVVIDMDHWVSEHFTREIFQELLAGKVETIISKEDRSPIKTL